MSGTPAPTPRPDSREDVPPIAGVSAESGTPPPPPLDTAAPFTDWMAAHVSRTDAPAPAPEPVASPLSQRAEKPENSVMQMLRELQALPPIPQPPPRAPQPPPEPVDLLIERHERRHGGPPPAPTTAPMPVVPPDQVKTSPPAPALVAGRERVLRDLHNLAMFFSRGRSTPRPTVAAAPAQSAEVSEPIENIPSFVDSIGYSVQAPMVALANEASYACESAKLPADSPLTFSVSSRSFRAELQDPNTSASQPHHVMVQYVHLPPRPGDRRQLSHLIMGRHWGSAARGEQLVIGEGDFLVAVTQDMQTGQVLAIEFADDTTAHAPQPLEQALTFLDGTNPNTTLREHEAHAIAERVSALLPRMQAAAALMREHLPKSS